MIIRDATEICSLSPVFLDLSRVRLVEDSSLVEQGLLAAANPYLTLSGTFYEIRFAPGAYDPNQAYGIGIIAHELHHLGLMSKANGPLPGTGENAFRGVYAAWKLLELFGVDYNSNPLETMANDFRNDVMNNLLEKNDNLGYWVGY